ncbi:MAG: glycosyltransferase [Acidobacteriota bacterium]
MSDTDTRTSIVIPTLDAGPHFRSVLETIVDQQGVSRPEILVVDSGSSDGTLGLAQEFEARILEVEPKSFNHGLTRNLGAREALGELIVFLSQDAEPADSSWLAHLIRPLSSGDVAGSYSRQLVRRPAHPFLASRQTMLYGPQAKPRRTGIRSHDEYRQMDPIAKLEVIRFDNVSSCIRKSVLARIPFRDVPFGEDLDWSFRAVRCGYSLAYEPRSQVYHTHELDHRSEFQRVYLDHQSLFDLVGLRTVPRLETAFKCGLREASRLRHLPRPPGRGRLAWELDCALFGFGQNLAQWLGPACTKGLKDGRRSARLVDDLVRFGWRASVRRRITSQAVEPRQ